MTALGRETLSLENVLTNSSYLFDQKNQNPCFDFFIY
jgi:hypothetical protein